MNTAEKNWIWIEDSSGNPLNTEDLVFKTESDLLDDIGSWKIKLKPLDDVDSDINPDVFKDDLIKYIRECFKISKKHPIELNFNKSGYLFRTTYWVFDAQLFGEEYYVMVVRDLPLTEFAVLEKNWELQNEDSSEKLVFTAEQAATFDLFDPSS